MPDLKITLSTSQAAKVIAVLKKKEGSPGVDEEGKELPGKSNAELVRATLLDHLKGLVDYDEKQKAQASIPKF